MREEPFRGLCLFGAYGNRKYLNPAERHRYIAAAAGALPNVRYFCLMLAHSGARISEVLALTPASFDIESGVVAIATLKRRRPGVVRQIPLPAALLSELDREYDLARAQRDPHRATVRIWRFSRTSAWRYVKAIMAEAGIAGTAAMPKGLRHGFGVNAAQSNVPLNLLQRWLGHASIETTAIYLDVVGPEERAFAERMWVTADAGTSSAPRADIGFSPGRYLVSAPVRFAQDHCLFLALSIRGFLRGAFARAHDAFKAARFRAR